MSRVIFESEKEARDFLQYFLLVVMSYGSRFDESSEEIMQKLKDEGYLCKTPIDEAKELYEAFVYEGNVCSSEALTLINKQREAIEYLKDKSQ